ESVRRGLVRARLRAPVAKVFRSRSPLRVGANWQAENLRALLGARPAAVDRRGKYIVWRFDRDAKPPLGLIVHLGMSGRFGLATPDQPHVAHTHFALRFTDDREVRLVDPRRFGGLRVDTLDALWSSEPLASLGPEPIDDDFDGTVLHARAKESRRALRDVLLDQSVVAGVGNIYAIEACHLAGVHPLIGAHRLLPSAWDRLALALREVMTQAIRNGGTTLRDFRDVSGEAGHNQDELRVYGRAGAPCHRCGAELRGFVHAGRGGVFCPSDQARPRGRVR
ncbi:MAG: bifunctional DNA-formamidopyrimidine glycosylase/DNA-(apurinic or apyrimidinic site) lyase, partial [Myxococcales bacterium]|nr:bifunctional DNA-formamidopyrimidine glycosylase/DNA-(apurinic or apyrimidinic site) lyase [Myxococcales bacterium]